MKIKITAELPVASEVRPKIGNIYDAVAEKRPGDGQLMYFVSMGNAQVGVFPSECEIIEGGTA